MDIIQIMGIWRKLHFLVQIFVNIDKGEEHIRLKTIIHETVLYGGILLIRR